MGVTDLFTEILQQYKVLRITTFTCPTEAPFTYDFVYFI